jgi:hypothetical protein
MTCDSMKRDKISRMGGGLTSQYKHSANFLGDDIIVNKSSRWRCKTWHKVAADAPGDKAHSLTKSLEEVSICKSARSAFPLACFNSHVFFFFLYIFFVLKIPNFCLDRPFGFSVHREYIPFFVPLIFAWAALSGFQSTGTLSIA